MSNAKKIIDKLTKTYPCTARPCEGTAALTISPSWAPGEDLVYRCDSCTAAWYQDGKPIAAHLGGGK